MRHNAKRPGILLLLLGAVTAALPARAQTRNPAHIVGPTSLTAWSNAAARVSLAWPHVAGADKYRVTRTEKAGAEIIIDERPTTLYVSEGADCAVESSQPGCWYEDVSSVSQEGTGSSISAAKPVPAVTPMVRHTVASGKVYTYRVWAIFSGPVVSPPSPTATVRAR